MAMWTVSNIQKKMLSMAKKRVEKHWLFWKPVAYNVLTFSEACACDTETLLEANIVADLKSSGKL